MGVRSNIPSGGITRLRGPRIGSVICLRTLLIDSTSGDSGANMVTHDMMTLASIASVRASTNRKMNVEKKFKNLHLRRDI